MTPPRAILLPVLLPVLLAAWATSACARPESTPSPPATPPTTVAATPTATPRAATPATAFADPFTYCGAVRDIDTPDARYTGPAIPEVVVNSLKAQLNAPRLVGVYWRCMGGSVYACTVGANLPCHTRADTSLTPTPGMLDYCRDNPSGPFIPAFATGRATIYEWRCVNGTPQPGRQLVETDARGFQSDIWYEIPRP